MPTRDYRDIIGGALLLAVGLFVAIYATRNYAIGTLTRMGPGLFPAALGFLLAGLGAAIVLPAFFRAGTLPKFRLRPFLACLAAVLLFAVLIERLGMVPAIVALAFAAVLADDKLKLPGALMLAAALAAMGAAIFGYGLGMTVPLFAWRT